MLKDRLETLSLGLSCFAFKLKQKLDKIGDILCCEMDTCPTSEEWGQTLILDYQPSLKASA